MSELHLQDRFLIPFFQKELGYQEVKANTIAPNTLIIEEDLQAFIATTALNQKPYATLLRKYNNNAPQLLADLIALIQERIASSRNMALFINANKAVTLQGIKLYLFYTDDSVIHDSTLFEQNIFSVVQELPYKYQYKNKKVFAFRPDLSLFVNGLYLGYSELKSNFTNQTAKHQGRGKVIKDYFSAVRAYYETFELNDQLSDKEKDHYRKDFLKVFEKAIHITTTDIAETYVIRTLSNYFEDAIAACRSGTYDRKDYDLKVESDFKPYPLLNPTAAKKDKLKELFTAHYGKSFIEKEILYYNFIERETVVEKGKKEFKDERGQFISPRPKQKFGTDKILAKIDEFLDHETEDDYFINQLEQQLAHISADKRADLIAKRQAYANNKHVYSPAAAIRRRIWQIQHHWLERPSAQRPAPQRRIRLRQNHDRGRSPATAQPNRLQNAQHEHRQQDVCRSPQQKDLSSRPCRRHPPGYRQPAKVRLRPRNARCRHAQKAGQLTHRLFD